MIKLTRYVIDVHRTSFHSRLKTVVVIVKMNLELKSVLEEPILLLKMGIGGIRTSAGIFTNATIRTVFLRKRSTSYMMAIIFVKEDILEPLVIAVISMHCFGVTITLRKV